MSFLGIGVPAAVNLGANVLGGLFGMSSAQDAAEDAFKMQVDLMNHQYFLQKNTLKHKHLWEVQDLKNAGLNPILSANSAGGMTNVGMGQAPMADTAGGFQKGAASANQIALASLDIEKQKVANDKIKADAAQTDAMANLQKADAEAAKTTSSIEQSESQSALNWSTVAFQKQTIELNRLMNEAKISQIQQEVINSIRMVTAQERYLRESGQAALTSAAAAASSAAAQHRLAAAQELNAQINAKNGEVRRQVDLALEGKATAETKEAYERILSEAQKRHIEEVHNPWGTSESNALGKTIFGLGESIFGNIKFFK